jgi:hypothetical protein
MRTSWKVSGIAVAAFGLGIAGGFTYAKQGKLEYTMTPAGTAKFAPVDPKQPAGIQMAVLSGDPKTGPVAFLLKLPKGPAPMHWHSSDYYAWTVEGQSKHWLPGKEADAKPNGPGAFWAQPGGSAATTHGDECLSDSCTVYIYMPGKFDFTPAKTDEKKPADKK